MSDNVSLNQISWGVARRMMKAGVMLQKAASTEDVAALDAAQDALQAILAPLIRAVPRSWLVDDAPADLDWKNPDSLDWLLRDRFQDLMTLVSGESEKKVP